MRTKKGSDAKGAMIEAAVKLFRARGYEGVGVAELLEVSGAPRGSLYFHFPGGKEQIAQEAVSSDAERVAALLERLRERSEGPDDYIEKLMVGWGRDMKRSDYSNGCVVAMVALELAPRSAALAEAANSAFKVWESEVAAAALQWGMSETFAAKFAAAALSAIEGAIVISRIRLSIDPFLQAAETLKALARDYLRVGAAGRGA